MNVIMELSRPKKQFWLMIIIIYSAHAQSVARALHNNFHVWNSLLQFSIIPFTLWKLEIEWSCIWGENDGGDSGTGIQCNLKKERAVILIEVIEWVWCDYDDKDNDNGGRLLVVMVEVAVLMCRLFFCLVACFLYRSVL